jgi:hypothetical protein
MATPLVGLADESCQGGSMVMTSKSRPEHFVCASASLSKLKLVTLTESGMHQNCLRCACSLNAASASSCFATLLIFLSSSSFSESSSSKNYLSSCFICLFTSFSIRRMSNSSFGKLSMNTVSSPPAAAWPVPSSSSSASSSSSLSRSTSIF